MDTQILDRIRSLRTLVVGDTMLDRYWVGEVNRISPEAPVPVVNVADVKECAGGAGNVAANITSLGARCELLSFVGDDDAGRRLSEILARAGVDRHLHIDAGGRTTEKLRIVARNQQLLRADFEFRPSVELLEQSVADFRAISKGVDSVVISDYGKGGLAHIEEMIEAAKERQTPVIVDPRGADYARYRGATLVTPNRDEFALATGVSTQDARFADTARELVQEAELSGLLVTRGEEGMTLFLSTGEVLHQDAAAREVFDVSGAGDTVVAVVAVGIALELGWAECINWATLGASAVVGRFGTSVVRKSDLNLASTQG
ncbi:MAG TPA: D-glycero-beta-D-manno-heptose-7-phosphate kinase [Gammaproteobacteria bacterium]|jgi:rfaE bifunctional protein kinase chain/domain|nr:D-glycero-beta-D-manno-heptose-7-phosphate kinase [Arenicellales bacterium]MDP6551493.1 D-glycero-beta-D-manno-heptose-7-phosphate kinase [Arenicellales bacterium]MDP6790993.1 D-glycero-beta-D-manno-heptose-7-phosphate kinase [Arenicellales bacterium]MDP6918539.1 D-glycero-beta-D-manno-heptose-7-phosphate kinase [Arenicellales bacterium]HCX86583.1 D-glycero-beta-D-manno-heptose-7-phosphate kinase [Gammaproteobacteria bacterium]|tara:strand:+ start:14660 stop:15610 length:951 start_codon:yes stop_codon:yes gene_type:complete